MIRNIGITFAVLFATMALALAQAAGGGTPSGSSAGSGKKDIEEAAEKLRQAKEGLDMEKAKAAAEGVLKKLPPKVGDTAKEALDSPENREKLMDAAKSAASSLLPEAQKALRRQSPAESPPPAAASPSSADQPPAAAPAGPVPMPLPPLTAPAGANTKNTVVIESDDATADLKNAVFVYSGRVRARHPQFLIECEELEVHMVKEDELPEKQPAPKVDDPIAPNGSKQGGDSRIKMAIARGPMVTIEKLADTGEVQQGKCKRAVYRGATGEIVMSEFPQVQRGNVLHIATDPSTEMTFDPNGKLRTTGGRQRTIVLPADSAQGAAPVPTQNSRDQ
jgi:lipopolysaccharide export system protein LptA